MSREQLRHALNSMAAWEVVVQWVGFRPDHIADDIETFADAGQYVYISSASVYEKPPSSWLITERTPTVNPFWDYSQQKIACERVLRQANEEAGFPMTIVRPSLTYGVSQIPVIVGTWTRPFTIVERMRRKARIVRHREECDEPSQTRDQLCAGMGTQDLWHDPDHVEVPARTAGEPRWLVVGVISAVRWSAVINYRDLRVRIISVRRSRSEEVKIYAEDEH